MAIRVGLIGMGPLGRAQLQRLTTFPDVQIAAICDSDRKLAEEAAASCGAGVHINFRTMIEAERLDALFVSLPPFSRGEPEIFAARAGIHLFVAGPVAATIEKAREIQKEIAKAGVIASAAYPWRYLSGAEIARESLGSRKIALVQGRQFNPVPEQAWRKRRESSSGRFLQEATDLIDLARFLAGEVTSVCAAQFEGIVAARTPGYDVEDAFAAVVQFRSGAVGSFVSSDVAIEMGTSLNVIADGLELSITPDFMETREEGKRVRVQHSGDALQSSQKAFLDAVKSGNAKSIRSPYADAVTTLEVAAQAVESALGAKRISL